MEVTLNFLLDSMMERIFDNKQCFLDHCLKKELGKQARKDLRQNLKDEDVIIYSDFSKGLHLTFYLIINAYLFLNSRTRNSAARNAEK